MINRPKTLWQSKTFWANVLTTFIGILGVVAGQEWIAEHPTLVSVIVTVTGVLNVLLRTVTSQPIDPVQSADAVVRLLSGKRRRG